jgi:hypothetical protein
LRAHRRARQLSGMKAATACLNAAWVGAQARSYFAFRAALREPQRAQEAILHRYLRLNATTEFGGRHQFHSIRSVRDFQSRVPLSDFDDYQEAVDAIQSGALKILTEERVLCLQPSSGSTRAAKLIPYTRTLQCEFGRAVGPWLFDLARRAPGILGGPAYWSVTPVNGQSREPGGRTPAVGFESDSAYLGGWLQRLVQNTLIDCEDLKHAENIGEFRTRTLLRLLGEPELRLISVWHPTFLTLLLEELSASWEQLLDLLARGLPAAGRLRAIPPRPRRASQLKRANPQLPGSLWPRLAVVSCWGDAHAGGLIAELKKRFAGVWVQPKGLIATEAVVSIPFEDHQPLAIRSHFYEFIDDLGGVRTASDLERGAVYSLAVTTGGGLYRYRLRDRVRVEDFVHATPSLRFLGKEDKVSDICGEKLSDGAVAVLLARLLPQCAPEARFSVLAPEFEGAVSGYVLYIESGGPVSETLSTSLECGLRENPNYALCIRLGQLRPASVALVPPGSAERYLERLRQSGRRLGDIKPNALSTFSDWRAVFARPSGVSR